MRAVATKIAGHLPAEEMPSGHLEINLHGEFFRVLLLSYVSLLIQNRRSNPAPLLGTTIIDGTH